MFYSFCELFIIFIFNFSRRLSDESDLPDFGAADIFKDYDGNISVSLASNQPTSGRDADLNLIGAFHSISRFLRNTSISFCRLCRTYVRIGAFVRCLDDPRGGYLLLIPFEDERSVRFENTHTFFESLPDVILP